LQASGAFDKPLEVFVHARGRWRRFGHGGWGVEPLSHLLEGVEVPSDAVYVPAEGVVTVWARDSAGSLHGEAEAAVNGVRQVVLTHTPGREILLPNLWSGQEPGVQVLDAPFDVRVRGSDVVVRVPAPGRYALEVEYPAPRGRVAVTIPTESAQVRVAIDTLVPSPSLENELRVRVPPVDGTSERAPGADVWRLDSPEPGLPWLRRGTIELIPGGAREWIAVDPWLVADARVLLHLPPLATEAGLVTEFVPQAIRIGTTGPTLIDVPAGGIDLAVELAPTERGASVYVDGALFTAVRPTTGGSATLRLRGLRPGPHVVIVAATGHQSRVIRFALANDEVRSLDVALSRRP
jgi:hypothetical protein